MSQIRFQVSFYIRNHNIDCIFFKAHKASATESTVTTQLWGTFSKLVFCACTGTLKSKGGWQLHFCGGTPGKKLLLSQKGSFLVCQCSWMKTKLTAFCPFTLCVGPTHTFRLYLYEVWEWRMPTTCWILRLQQQGTSPCLTTWGLTLAPVQSLLTPLLD